MVVSKEEGVVHLVIRLYDNMSAVHMNKNELLNEM